MIQEIFRLQTEHKLFLRKTDSRARIESLKKLRSSIEYHEAAIFEALKTDLRKSDFEAALTEVFFVYGEIDHAIKNLDNWMKEKSGKKILTSFFASNKIYQEPKGVVLIIAPWNYPFQLMLSPLISAIAAGNCAILKPSELSPATARVIATIIEKTFEKKEIACFEGGQALSEELLNLPFDHVFFTGSTAVGKIVMKAASSHLSSVTLELGGKSPAIITTAAQLPQSVEKIVWGKLTNAGQTCIAPDYLLIHQDLKADFIALFIETCHKMYFVNGIINKDVYGKIINEKHFVRLKTALEEAKNEGATVDFGGSYDAKSLTFLPTLISNCKHHSTLLSEEIFGPILPIITFSEFSEAIDYINERPKPLASYLFSGDSAEQNYFIKNTTAGGTCINDVLIHISNPNVPFGGVGPSGTGSSHGIYGFKAFSHERTVVKQSKINLTKLIYPPYNKEWLLKIMKKLF